MNGRANDGVRTVHAAVNHGGALYSLCRGSSRWNFCGEPGRLYLSVRTKAPATCKKCLRILAREGVQ